MHNFVQSSLGSAPMTEIKILLTFFLAIFDSFYSLKLSHLYFSAFS